MRNTMGYARKSILMTMAAIVAIAVGCGESSSDPARPRRDRSGALRHYIAGAKALENKQLDVASTELEAAVRLDDESDRAWFQLGEARRLRNEPARAAEAYDRAVRLKPADAMFRLRLGAALYEAAIASARQREATRLGRPVEEVTPDLGAIDHAEAMKHLAAAVAANPGLYNAHYYLGAIYRDQRKAPEALAAFTAAIEAYPRFHPAYVAAGKLLLERGEIDQAIALASKGLEQVRGQQERAELQQLLDDARRAASRPAAPPPG